MLKLQKRSMTEPNLVLYLAIEKVDGSLSCKGLKPCSFLPVEVQGIEHENIGLWNGYVILYIIQECGVNPLFILCSQTHDIINLYPTFLGLFSFFYRKEEKSVKDTFLKVM